MRTGWQSRREAAWKIGEALTRRLYPRATPCPGTSPELDLQLPDGTFLESKCSAMGDYYEITADQLAAFAEGRCRLVAAGYQRVFTRRSPDDPVTTIARGLLFLADVSGPVAAKLIDTRGERNGRIRLKVFDVLCLGERADAEILLLRRVQLRIPLSCIEERPDGRKWLATREVRAVRACLPVIRVGARSSFYDHRPEKLRSMRSEEIVE